MSYFWLTLHKDEDTDTELVTVRNSFVFITESTIKMNKG